MTGNLLCYSTCKTEKQLAAVMLKIQITPFGRQKLVLLEQVLLLKRWVWRPFQGAILNMSQRIATLLLIFTAPLATF